MRFRHMLSIAIDNFSNVYKLLVYQLITSVLFFGLSYTVVSINLTPIVESAEANELLRLLSEFFVALTSGDTAVLQGFQTSFLAAFSDFVALLGTMIGQLVWAVVGVVLLYLLSRFVNGIATYTAGIAIDNRMETYSKTRFVNTLFSNLKSSIIYHLIYIPFSLAYTVLSAVVCWFVFFYALSFVPIIFTIALAATAIIFLHSLKLTLISAWIPIIVRDKKGVCAAFRQSLSFKKNFWSRFSNFLACVFFIVVINVVGAVATLGSILFLTVPFSYLLILSLQFVCYYEDTGSKYFISYNQVENENRPMGL